jgi:predicted transcriptional regulator of viral defense system
VTIVNPKPHKFFGFGPVDVLGFKVMMFDREKTAIDCIDRPALAGGVGEAASILAAASRRLDWPKVVEYLERIDSTALVRRFGWVMDHVKADMIADIRERLLRLAVRGPQTWMGPNPTTKVRGAIGYDKTWRLFVNAPREELRESAGLGRRKVLKKDA